MIKVELENWNEKELQKAVVNKVCETVISREFKLYGNIPKKAVTHHMTNLKTRLQTL